MTVFNVYFDGGTSPGSSDGYGSWEVQFNGFSKRVQRQPFLKSDHGRAITNNVAEYLSLLGALEWLQSVQGKEHYSVHITGDSMLVINQVNQNWRVRKHHLQKLVDRCCLLLEDFKDWKTEWKPRKYSMSRFGH